MMNYTNDISAYFNRLKETIDKINVDDLSEVMNVLEQAREEGHQVFVMGNGGSAATASHYVCDFNKGISYGKEKMYKMICLNDNVHIKNYDQLMQNLRDAFQGILPEKSSFEI